jgi:hypothetical protein
MPSLLRRCQAPDKARHVRGLALLLFATCLSPTPAPPGSGHHAACPQRPCIRMSSAHWTAVGQCCPPHPWPAMAAWWASVSRATGRPRHCCGRSAGRLSAVGGRPPGVGPCRRRGLAPTTHHGSACTAPGPVCRRSRRMTAAPRAGAVSPGRRPELGGCGSRVTQRNRCAVATAIVSPATHVPSATTRGSPRAGRCWRRWVRGKRGSVLSLWLPSVTGPYPRTPEGVPGRPTRRGLRSGRCHGHALRPSSTGSSPPYRRRPTSTRPGIRPTRR